MCWLATLSLVALSDRIMSDPITLASDAPSGRVTIDLRQGRENCVYIYTSGIGAYRRSRMPSWNSIVSGCDVIAAPASSKRSGERAGDYIALVIDDPMLPQPIRANLFRDDDDGASWSLHWSRPAKRSGKD